MNSDFQKPIADQKNTLAISAKTLEIIGISIASDNTSLLPPDEFSRKLATELGSYDSDAYEIAKRLGYQVEGRNYRMDPIPGPLILSK